MQFSQYSQSLLNHGSVSIYTKKFLRLYDFLILGLLNQFVWRCPSKLLLALYDQHISNSHLDVGVGTGYFLDKCKFLSPPSQIHLLDLSANSLDVASKRINRYNPVKHQANILEPLQLNLPVFDSIGISYLLHCLPGDILSKEIVFKNLKPLLSKNGKIFGATIIGERIHANFLAKKIMQFNNAKGIFSNFGDSLSKLEHVLSSNFKNYSIEKVGCVALFSADTAIE